MKAISGNETKQEIIRVTDFVLSHSTATVGSASTTTGCSSGTTATSGTTTIDYSSGTTATSGTATVIGCSSGTTATC